MVFDMPTQEELDRRRATKQRVVKAGWAEKAVDKMIERLDCTCETCVGPGCQKLLQAEYARSVRIVKAEIKRVRLSAYQYSPHEKAYILTSLDNVLLALQRGRGGKG